MVDSGATAGERTGVGMAVDQQAFRDDTMAQQARDDELLDYPSRYTITTYGADFPVDALVDRMNSGEILLPGFQRGYVWKHDRASRFIESLLVGLPVPAIFLWKNAEGRFVVIDGKQRLETLQYFYGGSFGNGRNFYLKAVHPDYVGRTCRELGPEQKRTLDNALLHAFIVQQDQPSGDHRSIHHVFERLNTGATPLEAQEIRSCLYEERDGDGVGFVALLAMLNDHPSWRAIYGGKHARMRDEELILRSLALCYERAHYQGDMKKFLNDFMHRHHAFGRGISMEEMRAKFVATIDTIYGAIGERAFKPRQRVNSAVFDAVMVGAAVRLEQGEVHSSADISSAYDSLLRTDEFIELTDRSTAHTGIVLRRIELGVQAFQDAT